MDDAREDGIDILKHLVRQRSKSEPAAITRKPGHPHILGGAILRSRRLRRDRARDDISQQEVSALC